MSEIRVDTISEKTSANGVSIDGLTIKDGGITATTGAIIFNEASADLDFRVESNGDANMLFVDGGENLVRVGNNAHTNSLIAGNFDLVVGNESSGATGLAILSTNNENSYVGFFDQDNSGSFRGTIHYNHTNDYMQVYTNGTVGIRQHSNQVLSASAGVALGVGTANTASNVLDDYEEGTWTPVLKSASNTVSYSGTFLANYTKIGRMVHYSLSYRGGTFSGDVTGATTSIEGLPFTSSSTAGNRQPSTQVNYYVGIKFDDENVLGLVGEGVSTLEIVGHDGATSGYASVGIHSVGSDAYMQVSGIYYV